MPTYPLTIAGAVVSLTPPQWQTLCDLVAVLATRPLLTTWLAQDLSLSFWSQMGHRQTILMLDRLAAKGVLVRQPTGYQLAAGVREQVEAATRKEGNTETR